MIRSQRSFFCWIELVVLITTKKDRRNRTARWRDNRKKTIFPLPINSSYAVSQIDPFGTLIDCTRGVWTRFPFLVISFFLGNKFPFFKICVTNFSKIFKFFGKQNFLFGNLHNFSRHYKNGHVMFKGDK